MVSIRFSYSSRTSFRQPTSQSELLPRVTDDRREQKTESETTRPGPVRKQTTSKRTATGNHSPLSKTPNLTATESHLLPLKKRGKASAHVLHRAPSLTWNSQTLPEKTLLEPVIVLASFVATRKTRPAAPTDNAVLVPHDVALHITILEVNLCRTRPTAPEDVLPADR